MLTTVNHHLCSSDLPDKSCPEGSAACLVSSQGSFNMGFPTKQLELLSNDRYLHVAVEIGRNIPNFPPIRSIFCSLSWTGVFILGVFLMPRRLRLQYEASADSTPPEFCKGHVPAVSLTFICPSRRHQVGETHSDTC